MIMHLWGHKYSDNLKSVLWFSYFFQNIGLLNVLVDKIYMYMQAKSMLVKIVINAILS